MTLIDWAQIFILLPLLAALIVVVRYGRKELKKTPLNKARVTATGKALVYVFAAATLVWVFLPRLGAVGGFFGTLLSVLLALLIVLAIVMMPARLQRLHNVLWKKGPLTPGYSRSGRAVPYVRWARRIAMLVFVLFVLLAALVGGLQTTQAQVQRIDIPPVVQTDNQTQEPQASPTSDTPKPSPPAAGDKPAVIANPCDGPDPRVAAEYPLDFGTDNLVVCDSGDWVDWSRASGGQTAPERVTVKAWSQEGAFMYAAIDAAGVSYIIRTTDY